MRSYLSRISCLPLLTTAITTTFSRITVTFPLGYCKSLLPDLPPLHKSCSPPSCTLFQSHWCHCSFSNSLGSLCPRAFVLAVFSAWNVLPPNNCMACPLIFRILLKCFFLRMPSLAILFTIATPAYPPSLSPPFLDVFFSLAFVMT